MDVNKGKDINNAEITRNRRDVNNCRTPATAENANHSINAKDGRGANG